MKRDYLTVTALKSKSGFVWNDETGIDVTGLQHKWDELVRVCEHIPRLPMITNCH